MDMEKKSLIIALTATIVLVVVSVATWEFFLRGVVSSDDLPEYTISFSYYGTDGDDISMSEMQDLPQFSYEDVLGSGATDSGPLVKDVILLRVEPSQLSNDTMIVIGSSLTLQERTLSWQELRNESKLYIFDFTKSGTVKFTSPDTPKGQRVKDVTYIRVGV